MRQREARQSLNRRKEAKNLERALVCLATASNVSHEESSGDMKITAFGHLTTENPQAHGSTGGDCRIVLKLYSFLIGKLVAGLVPYWRNGRRAEEC